MKLLTDINQLRVGLLIQEDDVIAEVIWIGEEGIKIKGVQAKGGSLNINSDVISREDLQKVMEDGSHNMFIIGSKERNPEYYL